MDQKERYLSNPHITLDAKRRKQLGLAETYTELREVGQEVEVPAPAPEHLRTEVRLPKRRDSKS